MASIVEIRSIEIVDGTHVDVEVSGTPSGEIGFWAARTPEATSIAPEAGASAPFIEREDGTYRVTINHPSLWYLWASDDNGFSREPAAIWLTKSGYVDLDACMTRLQDLLEANRKGIEAGLRLWYPDTTLKQVVYGAEGQLTEWPGILITDPRRQEVYIGTGWIKEVVFGCRIACVSLHNDNSPDLRMMANMATVVQAILNQPNYETLTLSTGQEINFCQCETVEPRDTDLGNLGWVTAAQLEWAGRGNFIEGGAFDPKG